MSGLSGQCDTNFVTFTVKLINQTMKKPDLCQLPTVNYYHRKLKIKSINYSDSNKLLFYPPLHVSLKYMHITSSESNFFSWVCDHSRSRIIFLRHFIFIFYIHIISSIKMPNYIRRTFYIIAEMDFLRNLRVCRDYRRFSMLVLREKISYYLTRKYKLRILLMAFLCWKDKFIYRSNRRQRPVSYSLRTAGIKYRLITISCTMKLTWDTTTCEQVLTFGRNYFTFQPDNNLSYTTRIVQNLFVFHTEIMHRKPIVLTPI